MAKLLKLRRGTTTQHASFTGAEGEVTIDTTKDTAVVHDGSQAGGRPLAREDMSNVSSASIAGRLGTDSIAVDKIAGGTLPSDVKVITANINDSQINNAKIGANAQIQLSKLETITSNRIVGNDSGNAVPKELTAAEVRTIINVENGATGDQTNAEIRAAVEAASDSNVFTDADHSKLNAIEASATADQTAAEIRTLVESASDSNVFTDADHSKLNGIEAGATGDQTNTEIRALVNSAVDCNVFTNALLNKLNGIETSATADQTGAEINNLLSGQNLTASQVNATSTHGMDTAGWYRNDTSGKGLYNTSTTQHFYSDHDDYWNIAGGTSANGLRFRDDAGSAVRGYVYANNSNQIGFLNTSGSWSLLCDNSGNVTATGNVTAYSDARLKTDIHTINDALSICGKLRGVSYKWIKDGKAAIGVIAQEVEEVLPEVVLTQQVFGPEGEKEVKSVDYGKIVGVLINAINELKEEVEELKNAKIT